MNTANSNRRAPRRSGPTLSIALAAGLALAACGAPLPCNLSTTGSSGSPHGHDAAGAGQAPGVAPSGNTPSAPAGSAGGPAIVTRFGNSSVPRSSDGSYTAGYALMADLEMTTIREGWNWRNLQPTRGSLVSWMNLVDAKATQFVAQGVQAEAMIADTPDWASSDPGYASRTAWDASSPGRFTVPAGLAQPIFADGTDTWKPGAAVNPANTYAAYVWAMATRYAGKVGTWQVWNEPDYPDGDLTACATGANGSKTAAQRSWDGSVDDYVRMLHVTAVLVRAADPSARIALGGLGHPEYLAAILDRGAAADFDVVDFHAYGPDGADSNGVLDDAWGFLGRYQAMKQVVAQHGVTGKVYGCSETGFTADQPAEQAAYVAKVLAAASAQPDVALLQWSAFTNPGYRNMGMVDTATLTQKTAGYAAYKLATCELAGASRVADLSTTGLHAYRFRRADGKDLLVAWATGAPGSNATFTAPFAGQRQDDQGHAQGASAAGAGISLTTTPTYLIGN